MERKTIKYEASLYIQSFITMSTRLDLITLSLNDPPLMDIDDSKLIEDELDSLVRTM